MHMYTCKHTRFVSVTHTNITECEFRLCAQEFLISLITVRRSRIYYRVRTHTHTIHKRVCVRARSKCIVCVSLTYAE